MLLLLLYTFQFYKWSVEANIKTLAQFSDNETTLAVADEIKRSLIQSAYSGKIGELPVSSLLLKCKLRLFCHRLKYLFNLLTPRARP